MFLKKSKKLDDDILVKKWTLFLLVKAGLFDFYRENNGLYHLEFQKLVEFCLPDYEFLVSYDDKQQVKELFLAFQIAYDALCKEAQGMATLELAPDRLRRNLNTIKYVFGLSEVDLCILSFFVALHYSRYLCQAQYLINDFSLIQSCTFLSDILGLDEKKVMDALESKSLLWVSGLIHDASPFDSFSFKSIALYADDFAKRMFNCDVSAKDLLIGKVNVAPEAKLISADYSFKAQSVETLMVFMGDALASQKAGVNVLLYGPPGSGKTQLSRLIGQEVNSSVYEVISHKKDGGGVNTVERMAAYNLAQNLLKDKRSVLVFDEAENILDQTVAVRSRGGDIESKVWLNQTLEANKVPTIWIANDISNSDPAFIRRFSIILELDMPSRVQRLKCIRTICENLVSDEFIEELASHSKLTPGVLTSAASVLRVTEKNTLNLGQTCDETMRRLLNEVLHAQGRKSIIKRSVMFPQPIYQLDFVQCDYPIKTLTDNLKKNPMGSLCLYGPPGTGKTAYVRYLAKKLNKELVMRRSSEIISCFVGETEKNLSKVFDQAQANDAILFIDEADSFLSRRTEAKQQWQITQTNEMLLLMENFNGLFVTATNLLDHVDEAAMRRFDMKIEFGYLKADKAEQLLIQYCRYLKLGMVDDLALMKLHQCQGLTPGDFACVARKHRLVPITTPIKFVAALAEETAFKSSINCPDGFVKLPY